MVYVMLKERKNKYASMVFSRSGICSDFVSCFSNKESNILLACSGGPDSAAMMGISRVLLNRGLVKKVEVVHVNHNLREEALNDAEMCESQADMFDLPFFYYDIYPGLFEKNTYEAGRELRYQILQHHALKHYSDVIMTAHHADDIAETVMMHLARGCGINGLCGVRERNSSFGHVDVVRPLLKVRKKKLEELCNKANVPYCIDKSNFNTEKSRAYVRHSVIPVLEKLNPAFVEHVVKTAMFMQDIVEKESYGKNNRTKKHTSSIDG